MSVTLKQWRLYMELVWLRLGPLPLLGLLLLIGGLVLNLVVVPGMESATARARVAYQLEVAKLETPKQAVKDDTPLLDQRLGRFRAALIEKEATPDLLKLVFAEAKKQGIVLTQAEYRLSYDKAGSFYAYQMALPAKGSYPKIREFIDRVLETVPGAALEEISFKRDGVGAAAAESRIRFVFYLKDKRT